MVRLYALSLIILAVTVACAESERLGSLRPSDTIVTAEEDAAALEAVAELEANTAAALTGKASKADLAAEVNRATAAEAALDARLDAAEPAIVAAQADASAALGAAAEAKTAADAAAVKANAAHAAASNAASKADLSAESARAQAAEADAAAAAASALSAAQAAQTAAASAQTKANAAHTVASAAVTQSQLQAESARAQAAEADARNQAIKAAEAAAEAIGAASDASAQAAAAATDAAASASDASASASSASASASAASAVAEDLKTAIDRVEEYNVTRAEFDPVAQRAYLIKGETSDYRVVWNHDSHGEAAPGEETAATIRDMRLSILHLEPPQGDYYTDFQGFVFPNLKLVFPDGDYDRSVYIVRVTFVCSGVHTVKEISATDILGKPLVVWITRDEIRNIDQAGITYIIVDTWYKSGGSVGNRPYFVVTGDIRTHSNYYATMVGTSVTTGQSVTLDRVGIEYKVILPADDKAPLDGTWYAADPYTGGIPLDWLITKAELDDALADYTPGGGGITVETDPTVPAWAKTPEKPTYTADEVGAATASHNHDAAYLRLSGGTLSVGDTPLSVVSVYPQTPAIRVSSDTSDTVYMTISSAIIEARNEILGQTETYELLPSQEGSRKVVARLSDIDDAMSDLDVDGPVWIHPGDWTLSAHPLDDTVVEESATNVSTNVIGQIVGTRSLTVTQGNTVSVSPQPLDQLPTGTAPEALTYTLLSGPATLSTDGNAATLTATGDGLARVSATDGTVTRTVMTSFRQDVTDYADVVTYLGDADGTARAGVNDTFLAVLRARDTSVTVPSGVTPAVAACDYLYATKGTAPTAFSPTLPLDPSLCCMVDTKVSQYGQRHFAIAPHFALTAAHWWPGGVGRTGRWLTPDGTVATTTTTGGVRLRDWAIANGYTSEEASAVSDIYVFRTDNAIPDACIPYVIDKPAIDAIFGGSLRGINCYAVTQNGYLTYSYYLSDVGNSWASPGLLTPSSLGLSNLPCRSDIALLLAPSYAAQIYGGDSGMPVFFVYNGQPVVTSLFWTVGSGSSLVTGADILDAYIRQASGGAESLKRITIPSEVNE